MSLAAAPTVWQPNPGPQYEFLAQSCFEALYGGAVGGGKTLGLLLDATRYVHFAGYRAILFRRTNPELETTFVDVAAPIYSRMTVHGQRPLMRDGGKLWLFPGGARIRFAAMELEQDRFKYGSTAFNYIGFDELSTFTQTQYEFMSSRLRTTDPLIPCRLRAGTNPIGPGEEWVRQRFRWWVYPPGQRTDEFAGPYAKPGQVLYMTRDEDGTEHVVRRGTPHAVSRTFIPAKLEDNPQLMQTDYADRLLMLDPTTRAKLRAGDWMMRATPGTFFRREWFRIVDEVKEKVVARARFWDRAATEVRGARHDPDWTVGCLVALTISGRLVVEDVARARLEPGDVELFMADTIAEDEKRSPKPTQVLEQEPGASGKSEASHIIRRFTGVSVVAISPTGEKAVRARPVAAQTAPPANNVCLLRAPWNATFIDEHVTFPQKGAHDDQVDAMSGAVAYLAPQAQAAVACTLPPGPKSPLAAHPGGF